AVADREVELPVGAETEAVQVMADEREADAEAGVHHPALFGLALDLLEVPEVRDAGDPVLALPGQNSGGQARGRRVEALGEGDGVVDAAVAVAVLEEPDPPAAR